MKRDDPIRLKLRGDRERAQAWLEILCKGIGSALSEGIGRCGDTENIRNLISRVNGELTEAVTACEAAEKSYEPYWIRRRVRVREKTRRTRKSTEPKKTARANKK